MQEKKQIFVSNKGEHVLHIICTQLYHSQTAANNLIRDNIHIAVKKSRVEHTWRNIQFVRAEHFANRAPFW